jgi:hypothetical protein
MYVALDDMVRSAYWGKIVIDESGMKPGTTWDDTIAGYGSDHNEIPDGATVSLPPGSNTVLTAW